MIESERDENTCRKDFTPSEAVAMGKRVESLYAKVAKDEQRTHGGTAPGKPRNTCGKLPQVKEVQPKPDQRKTRECVAKTVGMSGRQYEKAKAVVESGNQQAIDQMNKTGKVDPAFRAVKREEKKEQLRSRARDAAKSIEKPQWSIILGDCIERLPEITNARLIFADPPYNIGIDYGAGRKADLLPAAQYLNWCQSWMKRCVESLTPDGSLWVMICDEWADHFGILLRDAGLHRRAWIKWYETFGVNCTNNFNRCSRHIFHYVRDPKRFVFNAESQYIRRPSDRQLKYGDKRADPDGKLLDDVWMIPRLVDNHEERIPDFPTQVPLEVMRRIVACASDPGDLVADPFCGSGSTGAAALQLGRRFIGIESGEHYWDLATVRLAGVTPFALDAR